MLRRSALLLLVFGWACKPSMRAVPLTFRIPTKHTGFFILPRDAQLDRRSTVVTVPKDGICNAVPPGPWNFTGAEDLEGRVLQLGEDMGGPPEHSQDEVRLRWPQQDYQGQTLFYVGSQRDFDREWDNRKIGLKPILYASAPGVERRKR